MGYYRAIANRTKGLIRLMMNVDLEKIHPEWRPFIESELRKPYFEKINAGIEASIAEGKRVFPPHESVLAVFQQPKNNIKVVILGQDPYHGFGQAHGLAFSVQRGVKIPPSLRNIYIELESDIEGYQAPQDGDLTAWCDEGVFLLNAVMTVEEKSAGSHAKLGWEKFTSNVIEAINRSCENVVFILWGSHAQKKGANIDAERHLILQSVHPSPLSSYRGFFGSKPFSKANEYLIRQGKSPVNWQN